jgi:hypothetical protein
MPQISAVLKSGATASSDFTLHDEEHAERVAEKMADVIPNDVLPSLSDYELALLLLSAYLHDIGMTPERGKVAAHRRFLLDGDADALEESERHEFQRWLDESGYEFVPPIPRVASLDETVRTADEVLTYYARDRHNDWSEEWIRSKLEGEVLGTYVGWLEDLVALCRSHHEGYETLVADRFNPRPVGVPAQVINLRYLAAALRVADVLDIDPERTPEAVLHHRDVSPRSLIYWYKDHEITLTVEQGRVSVYARPTRAFVHRAVEETVSAIEAELALCRRLDDVRRFSQAPGPGPELPHRWDLHPYVYRDLQSRDGTYEYIDGAFRPNTRRILEMLSGTELYGERFAAVREALQNAFDAVRERIAYQRLRQRDPSDPSLEVTLGNLHLVQVRVERVNDRIWLIVADDGIGMTKTILRDHFLVSGSPRRHQVLELERRCASVGFTLGRTGQFGLGALSYFMIADRAVIVTRRMMEGGDAELTGWRFESDGIGTFGELRRDTERVQGTELRLRLRPDVVSVEGEAVETWISSLTGYVQRVLGRVPCQFEIMGNAGTCLLQRSPGWTTRRDELEERLLHSLRSNEWIGITPEELLPLEKRRQREADRSYWVNLKNELRSCLRWKDSEKDLPNGVGRCRLHLPYFDLPLGRSLVFARFLSVDDRVELRPFGDMDIFSPQGSVAFFWKGFSIHAYDAESTDREGPLAYLSSRGVTLEMDLSSAAVGDVSVDRGSLVFSRYGVEVLEEVKEWAEEVLSGIVQEFDDPQIMAMNRCVSGLPIQADIPLFWIVPWNSAKGETSKVYGWKEIIFPQASTTSPIILNGHEVDGRPPLRATTLSYRWWGSRFPEAGRLVLSQYWLDDWAASVLWNSRPPSVRKAWLTAQFPPEWSMVCGVTLSEGPYQSWDCWNADHPLIQRISDSAWQWWLAQIGHDTDPLAIRDELLSDISKAATWLVQFVSAGEIDVWEGLKDRDPGFLSALWRTVFGSDCEAGEERRRLLFIGGGHFGKVQVRVFTLESGFETKDLSAHLPTPSEPWVYRSLGEPQIGYFELSDLDLDDVPEL